ncbi:Uncharacterized protein TCM_032687 [Theobroma cacao]|uniref:Uncharacterized protein n=1 Tax=Theobroma cacao TaxID=3641 RepID=A0A061F995_THECC|nr:Uncharacterized protein TCM_032687 [Theobroma cacao]
MKLDRQYSHSFFFCFISVCYSVFDSSNYCPCMSSLPPSHHHPLENLCKLRSHIETDLQSCGSCVQHRILTGQLPNDRPEIMFVEPQILTYYQNSIKV